MEGLTRNIDRPIKDLMGGINEIFLFPYVKYSRRNIGISGQEITEFPYTAMFSVYSTSSNYNEKTFSENGSVGWDQNITFQVLKTEKESEIYKLIKQDYRAIYIDRNNNVRLLGLFNGLTAEITNDTGSEKGDFSGYNVTLSGKESQQALFYPSFLEDNKDGIGFIDYRVTSDSSISETITITEEKIFNG